MKKFDKQKVLEKLQELDSTFKLTGDNILDEENYCVLFLNEANLIRVQKGLPHTGGWSYRYALTIEYLHKYKDEIIIEEYTNKEVAEVLKNKGFELNGDSIYTENNIWITGVRNVVSCLNDKVEERTLNNYDKEELILATIAKNELEKGE